MKHVISLISGIVVGATLFIMGVYYNPFSAQQSISPLAVSSEQVLDLAFTTVPGKSILYTNNGDETAETHPDRVTELWEPAIVDTTIAVTTLLDGRGQLSGIGIKASSLSESTQLLAGEAIIDSSWHIYLPGRGTLVVDQSENYWTYLREIVIPARWSSGDNWKGSFHGITTNGPGALGTARVSGGSGVFAGLDSEAVESVTAKAYSAITGPVVDGRQPDHHIAGSQ